MKIFYAYISFSISLSCFLINSDNRPTLLTKHETKLTLSKKNVFGRNVFIKKNIYNNVQHAFKKDTKENYTHSPVLLQKLANKNCFM